MAAEQIDPVINTELRMRLTAALYGVSNSSFEDLKLGLGITDSNLSKQLKVLEDADYIVMTKVRVGRHWKTRIALSENGVSHYLSYRRELLAILNK